MVAVVIQWLCTGKHWQRTWYWTATVVGWSYAQCTRNVVVGIWTGDMLLKIMPMLLVLVLV